MRHLKTKRNSQQQIVKNTLRIDLEAKTYIESAHVEIFETDLQERERMIGMQSNSRAENVGCLTQNGCWNGRGNYTSDGRKCN